MEVEFDLNDLQNIEDEDINEVIELLSKGEVNGNFLQWAEERQLENLRGIMIDTCEVIQVHLRGIGSELAAILNDTDLRSRFHIFRALLNIAKILVDMPTADELKVDLPSLNPVFKNNISNGVPIDPQIEKLRQALSKFQMCLSEVVAKVSSINDYAYRTTSLAHANGASKILKEVWDELSPIRESLSISPRFLNEKDETTVQKLSDASESDQYYGQEEKSTNLSRDTLRNRKESMGENLNLLHTAFDKERTRASTMMIRPKSAMMMNEIPQEKPDQIVTPSQTTNPRSSLVPPLNLSVPPTAGSIEGSSSSNINPSPHSNNESIISSTSSTTTTSTTTTTTTATTPSTTSSPPKRAIDIEVTLSFQKTPTIATPPAQTKGKERSSISLNDVSVSVADQKKTKKKPKKKSGCSCFGGGVESDEEEEVVVKLDSPKRETSPRNVSTSTITPTLSETPGPSPRKESIPLHKQLPTLRSGSISSQSPDAKILRNLKQDSSGSLKIKTPSPTASIKQKTLHSFVAKSRIPLKDVSNPVEELPPPACIFGTPLQDLERREDGGFVPQFLHKVRESISLLSSAQLDEALSDAPIAIETHKESINAGNPLSANPKECIALIKSFLSDLPQPLLCYQDSSYDDYISLDPIEDLNWKLSHLKSLLFSLPLSHFTLTQFILKFLHSLAFSGTEDNSESGNQKDGRVPLARLGDVFGPVMLRQKVITEEHLPQRARVSSLLIEHSPYLTKMDDPDLTFTPKQQGSIVIHSATVAKLVERLADPFYKGDPDFTKMILLAFTYFTTARELLLSIISLYWKKWGVATKWENKHHQRILFVFNLWLQRDTLRLRDDVDFKLALSNFLHETPEGYVRPQTERPHFMFIEQWLKKNPLPVEALTHDERKSRRLSRMPPTGLSSNNNNTISDNDLDEIIVPTKEEFFERDDSQIAEQMAYIDNKLFRSIKSSEFLHKNFENRTTSPCFTAMMHKFNEWGHWVASEIVSTPEAQNRAKMISKFVRVAQKCLELQAFNTAYAIVAGLGNASVQRLKQTWALVSKETMAVYTSLQTVFDMSLNYRNYRTLLSESPSPLIPYLGLYPKDLFGIEENKATFFSPGVVNVGKLRNLYEIIHPLVDYQLGKNYSIKIEPDLNSFLSFHLKVLSQDEVYKHSLLCEPRVQHAIP